MSPSRFCQVNGSSNIGPYKPVPPPKPFAGNQQVPVGGGGMVQHRFGDTPQTMQNGQLSYPHILVTEQGQFVTHSTKFPIEEGEKNVRNFSDKNYSQGSDNPGLLPDSSMGIRNHGLHIQQKEMMPNHYAQMRPYDPAKYPQFISNGHQPSLYQGTHLNTQQGSQGHQEHWQNHMPNRFQPPVNQSPDKRLFMNDPLTNKPMPQDTNCYPSSHQQHNLVVREQALEQDKNSHYYQESAFNSGDQNALRYKGIQLNGMPGGEGNCRPQYVSSGSEGIKLSSCSNPETNGVSQNGEADDKKEDKWESLKRAGKKYSNFKNILSNKFNKNEVKGNVGGYNSEQTKNKGTNSQDLSKSASELNSDVVNSERLHNGENHLHENKNFQRVVTYSSLNSKLDTQQLNGQGPFLNSTRYSGRLPYNEANGQAQHSTYETQRPNINQPVVLGPPKRAESCTHLGAQITADQTPKLPQWGIHHRSDDNLTRPLASDQSYPDPMSTKLKETADGHFLPSREGRVSGSSDSGRGTGGGRSASEFKGHDTSLESGSSNRNPMLGHSSGNESEWIDLPDSEEKQMQQFGAILHNSSKYPEGSKTPPLPPLSPEMSPRMGCPRNSKPKKNTQSHRNNMKPDIVETTEKNSNKKYNNPSTNDNSRTNQNVGNLPKSKGFSSTGGTTMPGQNGRDRGVGVPQNRFRHQQKGREKEWRNPLDDDDDDDDDLTSTDAALDLNSVLDAATEITTDDDLASTRDDETYLIRRQLEGLEGMYSEVLKVLGGRRNVKAPDPRLLRRKVHGSMSSLPSSVMSSRCIRDKKGKVIDERLRRTNKDISRSTHKRFQRLESHVVTLARSVAHLSSEMRTQQLMLQEFESIRNDISALKLNVKSPSIPPLRGGPLRGSRLWNGIGSQNPTLSNPEKVKKLTQFFGDEPPLVRIFLKKLGYEKYAPIFEQEKIGMLELPYMTEERLQKIGIPLGPRLRILEESRGPITRDGNLSVYVV